MNVIEVTHHSFANNYTILQRTDPVKGKEYPTNKLREIKKVYN
jgi:hypothetical protein